MIENHCKTPDGAERAELVGVLARAFRDNPMNREIHGPRPSHRLQANRAGLSSLVLDTAEIAEARVIHVDSRIVGGWVATPPSLRVLPRASWKRQVGCFMHQGARAMDRWSEVGTTLHARRPLADHWYLAILGVDPAWQGQGVGTSLLEELFAVAAERNEGPIYLECDREESIRFYCANGFVVRDEKTIHGVRCRCLGRGFADET